MAGGTAQDLQMCQKQGVGCRLLLHPLGSGSATSLSYLDSIYCKTRSETRRFSEGLLQWPVSNAELVTHPWDALVPPVTLLFRALQDCLNTHT